MLKYHYFGLRHEHLGFTVESVSFIKKYFRNRYSSLHSKLPHALLLRIIILEIDIHPFTVNCLMPFY
jgi:hypothetical protein